MPDRDPHSLDARYLDARQAAERLGVSRATLYAYVSRGLIRSEAVEPGQRRRQYHLEDIERLRGRRQLRRDPDRAVVESLHYGEPILESSITLIRDGRLHYRGRDAIRLAQEETFERVAALLWTGDLEADLGSSSREDDFLRRASREWAPQLAALEPVERCQVMLPLAGRNDLRAFDLRPSTVEATVATTGARILSLLAAAAAADVPHSQPAGEPPIGVAATLARAWSPSLPTSSPRSSLQGRTAEVERLLEAALILCADHELNVSAFTARCVASAGATPYEVVSAGLAALKGAKHGGVIERVGAFLREVEDAGSGNRGDVRDRVRKVVANRLRRGEEVPGFGHPMYPSGDPRARLLLRLVRESPLVSQEPASEAVGRTTVELTDAVTQVGRELLDAEPTIDLGLWLLARVLSLPIGGAMAIFALGRTAGWLGQAIEQYREDRLIRPRARYTGPLPTMD